MSVAKNIEAKQKIEKQQVEFNPFPGLRPFRIQESHLFFGREGQSDEVLEKLSKNRFVAVIGASGSGKSSLIYCGLTPILHGGFITETGDSWRIIASHPGNRPIENLAEAIVKSEFDNEAYDEKYFNDAITASVLRSSSLGLIEAIGLLKNAGQENVLVLIDQFEELFRYKKNKDNLKAFNEALAFVKLLLEAVKQDEVPIYVAITMRSDFIGECGQYQELTSLINNSHYLIPQMTRDDFRKAIEGPIAVGEGKISESLINRLLNEIGDKPDQLPILQHALMRTWDYWARYKMKNEPLDISHYEAIGTMQKALSQHANVAYDELSPRGKQICESVFKTLTERGGDNRGIRHPTSVKVLAAIARASTGEVIQVVDKFRLPSRSFLLPTIEKKLTEETVVDISHESLMRIWDKLLLWTEEEAAAIKMYLRLAEAAALNQKGKSELWRPPDLHLGVSWREKQQPTLTWAERFDPAFERTMSFLEASEQNFKQEEQNKVRIQKRALRRSRMFALILGTAAVIALGFLLYSFVMRVEAEKQRQLAEKQKQLALKKSKEAEREREKAIESAKEANRQRQFAETQRREAKKQEALALKQKNRAEMRKKQADSARTEAENAREEAFRMRLLSIAQSMAVKSQQIGTDNQLKALVALQAYLFNKKYGGSKHNHDIYNALYDAQKAFEKEDFNALKAHNAPVREIALCPDGKTMYSASSDGILLEWQLETQQYDTLAATQALIRAMAQNNEGNLIAIASENGEIQIFDNQNQKKQHIKAHNAVVLSLAFSPKAHFLLSTATDSTYCIWNTQNGKKISSYKHNAIIQSIALSPDGKTLAAATEAGELLLWNFDQIAAQPRVKKQEQNPLLQIAFNHDASLMASGDKKGNIKIRDTKTGEILHALTGHTARITGLTFSPNGQLLASASLDGTLQIFSSADFDSPPIVLRDNNAWVWTLAFSPDSKKLFSGGQNNQIRYWLVNQPDMAQKLAQHISRNLTQNEWNKFVAKDIQRKKTKNNLPLKN